MCFDQRLSPGPVAVSMEEALSIWKGNGHDRGFMTSNKKDFIHMACLAHSAAAIYCASMVESATTDCLADPHETGLLPRTNKIPGTERRVMGH